MKTKKKTAKSTKKTNTEAENVNVEIVRASGIQSLANTIEPKK